MRDDTGASLVRAGIGAWLALIALQVAWHGFLAPPASMSRLAAVAWAVVPIALPLLVLRRGVNRALLVASTVALLYFCHGVMELWAAPEVRMLAAAEVVLALGLIVATGTIGMIGRRRARRMA